MHLQSACVVTTLVLSVLAIPQPLEALVSLDSDNSQGCIPQDDLEPKKRAAAVEVRNKGFIYGPSLIGQAAFFPNGTLGNARSKADYDLWAGKFLGSMQALSGKIRGRKFDKNGLSLGMPFIYRTLDPNYIPFFCSV